MSDRERGSRFVTGSGGLGLCQTEWGSRFASDREWGSRFVSDREWGSRFVSDREWGS